MRVALHFDGLSTNQLRVLLTACSRMRDSFLPDGGSRETWRPTVSAEGPEKFTAHAHAVDVTTALWIVSEMDGATR